MTAVNNANARQVNEFLFRRAPKVTLLGQNMPGPGPLTSSLV